MWNSEMKSSLIFIYETYSVEKTIFLGTQLYLHFDTNSKWNKKCAWWQHRSEFYQSDDITYFTFTVNNETISLCLSIFVGKNTRSSAYYMLHICESWTIIHDWTIDINHELWFITNESENHFDHWAPAVEVFLFRWVLRWMQEGFWWNYNLRFRRLTFFKPTIRIFDIRFLYFLFQKCSNFGSPCRTTGT